MRVTFPSLLFALVAVLSVVAASPCVHGDELPTRFDAVPRIVAIGDVHGDLGATRRALQLAGATNEKDEWVGGELVVVQTGDQLDRGDEEQAILDLFSRLAVEAESAGGAFHVLNGNHELMNARLDLRYVTEGGYEDFRDAVEVPEDDSTLAGYDENHRARVVAFRPGGRYAKVLAGRNTIIVIGDNVFVHGGVLTEHVEYGVERINREARQWLRGDAPIPEWLERKDSPVWARQFSDEVGEDDCAELAAVLEKLGAKRMIVGHTPQTKNITPYCAEQVWCIDTGMASHYGGEVCVLEIEGDEVRALAAGE
ncbi:MAG: calcineurin [Gemmatimonadetes bacterium]|nr:calcineurin [Gemmatimonadota bacterium]